MTNKEFIKSISFEGEEWKDVVGYEGLYMVSSLGRVTSLYRTINSGQVGFKELKPGLLSFSLTKNDYFMTSLWKNNKEKHYYIHRLVAEAFIPNPNNYQYVDHLDTNKLNNKVSNLKWCTSSMNTMNPITRKRRHEAAKRNPNTQRWIIRPVVRVNMFDESDIKYYESVGSTAEDGCNPSSISAVCRGNRKSYWGYRWYYLEDYETLINKSKNSSIQKDND